MEQVIFEQIQRLPESLQQDALRYIEDLVAQHTQHQQKHTNIERRNAFGIWKGQVWMADDFDAPLDDLQEYM
jgi:Protein of unknown function (DUF2281)